MLGLCLILFAGGVVRLFFLRFEAGDIYAPYSTLRSDPLGTRVFYEGLKVLRPGWVRRNHDPLSKMDRFRKPCLFLLGVRPHLFGRMSSQAAGDLEGIMLNGGTVVIAFRSEGPEPSPKAPENGQQNESRDPDSAHEDTEPGTEPAGHPHEEAGTSTPRDTPENKSEKDSGEGDRRGAKGFCLESEWGFTLERVRTRTLAREAGRVSGPEVKDLPSSIPWHSFLAFGEIQEPWRPVYMRGERPVIMERSFGRGRLVLSTDTYLFSNEAMVKDRYSNLLAWFAGKAQALVFDETHLGTSRRPGIASLVWTYRLHWLVLGLFLVSALFIWKNAVPFVPPREGRDKGNQSHIAGRDATAGLISLLRRSIPETDLLGICYREWAGIITDEKGRPGDKADQVKAALDRYALEPGRKRDSVGFYRKVCRMLSRRQCA
jgi:hypothetical protein